MPGKVPSTGMTVCGNSSLSEWVAQGHDHGTTLHPTPTDDALVAMGRELLGIAAE